MKVGNTRRGALSNCSVGIIAAACLLFIASTVVAQTDCHKHGDELWCIGPDGKESMYTATPTPSATNLPSQTSTAAHDDEHDHEKENCHFHAGVEHCGNDDDSSFNRETDCVISERDYNRGLRIGSLFIVLFTSSVAVFGPIFLSSFTKLKMTGIIFTVIKQFGTGVIVATAFIHLLTHGNLMFTNRCIGELQYEAVATAIAMAGIFLSFIVEYFGDRLVQARARKATTDGPIVGEFAKEDPDQGCNENDSGDGNRQPSGAAHAHSHGVHSHGNYSHHSHLGSQCKDDKVSVLVMEAGIVFHSILIGLTLIVAGDSVFKSLLVVIIFHQMFEGLALGTRISYLPTKRCSFLMKMVMGAAFAAITPIGMAIGVGVLNKFNGNDKNTLIAMGTLDSLSAGILAWVGLVEMWAADWLYGEMRTSGFVKTTVGMVSLMAGMALMGLLGKWA